VKRVRSYFLLLLALTTIFSSACLQPDAAIPPVETTPTSEHTQAAAQAAISSEEPADAPNSLSAELQIAWKSPIEPPQQTYEITIALPDDPAQTVEWTLADAKKKLAGGTLASGETTEIQLEVDWDERVFAASQDFLTFYACSSGGDCTAQLITVDFYRPPTAELTPTASCGYAHFSLVSSPDIELVYPESEFALEIANEGILQCGTLDWQIAVPSLQPPGLSRSPEAGTLEGPHPGETTAKQIVCSLDWTLLQGTVPQDLFLTLYAFPQVNGSDSANLIHIRLRR
jgi:hypothetical protein